jgi:hypothetical protein
MLPPKAKRLSRPIQSEADVTALSAAERGELANWLARLESTRPVPQSVYRRRRFTLLAVTGAALFLLPWIAVLSVTLPSRYTTHQWRVAWVGFDIALVVSFLFTAWSGWRSRQVAASALVATGTLLLCDAWFDLTMSWGSNEQVASIITAILAEIPFAVLLFFVAARLWHSVATYVWHLTGRTERPPGMMRLPLLLGGVPREKGRLGSR